MQSVVDAVLLLLHLDFRSSAHVEHSHAAGELGQTLLELLLVVVAGGGLDLRLDLADAGLDRVLVTHAVDDSGVVLVDGHLLGRTEVGERRILKRQSGLLRNHGTSGEDGDVLEHGLAAVSETWGLHCGHFQSAADLVDHERSEGLSIDVLGDDEQRTAGLRALLEHGQQVLHVADLLLEDEDVGRLQLGLHLVGVGDEVGAQVAAVELHALHGLDFRLGALGLLYGDHALVADFLHGLGR